MSEDFSYNRFTPFHTEKTVKFRTICEVHREIYDLIQENMVDVNAKEEIEKKLEEAFLMAKKMNAKLRQYKHNYDAGWWEKESTEIRHKKHTLRSQRIREKKKNKNNTTEDDK